MTTEDKEKLKESFKTAGKIVKGGIVGTKIVAKLGEGYLVNGVTKYICEKIGLSKWKTFCVKVFTTTALVPFIDDQVTNFEFENYMTTVNSTVEVFTNALDKGGEDEETDQNEVKENDPDEL